MSFFALGVNHQTASVELREQVAFNAERLAALLLEQNKHSSLNDLVVVSTCNRTEVYAMTEDVDSVLTWLAQVNNIDVKQLIHHVYRYENFSNPHFCQMLGNKAVHLTCGNNHDRQFFRMAKDL